VPLTSSPCNRSRPKLMTGHVPFQTAERPFDHESAFRFVVLDLQHLRARVLSAIRVPTAWTVCPTTRAARVWTSPRLRTSVERVVVTTVSTVAPPIVERNRQLGGVVDRRRRSGIGGSITTSFPSTDAESVLRRILHVPAIDVDAQREHVGIAGISPFHLRRAVRPSVPAEGERASAVSVEHGGGVP